MCTKTQEKRAVTPQETDPDLPVSVQESLVEVWVGSGLLLGSHTECRVCTWDLLKEVTIIFITSTIVWSQVITGREQSSTHQQKNGLKI